MLKVRPHRLNGGILIGVLVALTTTPSFGTPSRTGRVSLPDTHSSTMAESTAPSVPQVASAFPLGVRPGERHLVDSAGRPFLVHGDTAWSLIAELTTDEAEHYLEDRRRRGFNTILVNLIEHRFATRAPANVYGQSPFLMDKDFSTPNEAYFDHAEWVLRRANDKGLLVLLAPAYVGNGGGGEGWYQAMKVSGAAKLREYGRYLGRRFGGFPNILWVHGGDYDPPDKDLVRAIVEGIREFDPDALHTAHASPGTAALEYWAGEEWLKVNNVYTYESVRHAALRQYSRPERLPFILFESAYENEHGASEYRLRKQAYQALLAGAAGQIFGNNPIWHFSGPGIYAAPVHWREALDSRGSQSMAHLRTFFSGFDWWRLEPSPWLIADRMAYGGEAPTAARAADGSFAVVYFPSLRSVALDLRELAGPRISAWWFDPASGETSQVPQSFSRATGFESFRPTGRNSADLEDWLLVLKSRP